MEKTTITAVSYLNTLPYVYGIETRLTDGSFVFTRDVPAECARKIIHGEAEIGLVPVAVLPQIESEYRLLPFGIAADGPVDSVLLLSQTALGQIKEIHLDRDSRTSVQLVQILAEKLWNISPEWVGDALFTMDKLPESILAIGDKAFQLRKAYRFAWDLSAEWQKLSKLPFVFACWVVRKNLEAGRISDFNKALSYGTDHIQDVVGQYQNIWPDIDLSHYLQHSIKFRLEQNHFQGLSTFLQMSRELSPEK